MTLSSADIFAWIASFLWPFVRFSAMFLAAPFFGARSIPVRSRVVLAMLLALMIAPTVPAPDVVLLSADGFILLLQQVLAGVVLGLLLQAVFAAVVMAGQTIATTMGLGFASTVDPQNGVQVAVVGQFYLIMATLIFLAVDGHLVMIELLAGSFLVLPISTQILPVDRLFEIVLWCGGMFASSVLISLPVVAGVLLVNVALGVVTRAAPQLNIFAVGFPLTILVGFTLMLVSIPVLEPVLDTWFLDNFQFMTDALVP
ncbi:MAG: flagellar biosynthetic protein FliR [Halieaceae bacterium]|nr:flagellar biosynthetic protein FliR [Halieaceae bacterium]